MNLITFLSIAGHAIAIRLCFRFILSRNRSDFVNLTLISAIMVAAAIGISHEILTISRYYDFIHRDFDIGQIIRTERLIASVTFFSLILYWIDKARLAYFAKNPSAD